MKMAPNEWIFQEIMDAILTIPYDFNGTKEEKLELLDKISQWLYSSNTNSFFDIQTAFRFGKRMSWAIITVYRQ